MTTYQCEFCKRMFVPDIGEVTQCFKCGSTNIRESKQDENE
jgi:rRNA maturation endonuclease Nob1